MLVILISGFTEQAITRITTQDVFGDLLPAEYRHLRIQEVAYLMTGFAAIY